MSETLESVFQKYTRTLKLKMEHIHFQHGGLCLDGRTTTRGDLGGPGHEIIEAVTYIDHLRDSAGAAIRQHLERHQISSTLLFERMRKSSPGLPKDRPTFHC